MNSDFTPELVSAAFRFYSRTMVFPYDELTHEFQYLLREIEKAIETDTDNTIASRILDVLNFYQGEEMHILQGEFTRMFTSFGSEAALIPVMLGDLNPGLNRDKLLELLYDSAMILDLEDNPDSIVNIMDYFSSLIPDDPEAAEAFFEQYIKTEIPELCRRIYQFSTMNFYKEAARGLDEVIQLIS